MHTIIVKTGDILTTPCDVAILKYAQAFFGADLVAAEALGMLEDRLDLPIGSHIFVPTEGRLACERVLFFGVCDLFEFRYAQIREFAKNSLHLITSTEPHVQTIAMTIHGMGYGLDEQESFDAQIAGIMEHAENDFHSLTPLHIEIVERNANRADRLRARLEILLMNAQKSSATGQHSPRSQLPDAGFTSESKKHVFVAMPYDEEMEDVYEFGIKEPINLAGCLCERCDRSVFTGDVMERIKSRINTATVVIADLTGANPNVYLEVGYAWGRRVPTLLVAKEGEELQFDVRSHRCVYYKNISHLRRQLTDLMPTLTSSEGKDGDKYTES